MSSIVNPSSYTRLYAAAATATVANTTVETTLIGAGAGSLTIPANFLTVGRMVRVSAIGVHSASGNPSIRVRAYLSAAVVLDTGLVSSGNSTNATWEMRGFITCYSVGGTGSVYAQGFYEEDISTQSPFGMANTSPVTINTTTALTFNLTAQWGTASVGNSDVCSNFLLEALG